MNYLQSTQNTANNPGHGRWFAIRGCCDVVLTVGAHHVYGTEPVVRLRQILHLNKKERNIVQFTVKMFLVTVIYQ